MSSLLSSTSFAGFSKRLSLAVLLVVAAPSASAAWSEIGEQAVVSKTERGILIQDGKARLRIDALSPDIIRVHYRADGDFADDRSFAVVQRDFGAFRLETRIDKHHSELATASLRLRIEHHPLRLAFFDTQGNSLDQDDDERGMARVGSAWSVSKRLRDDEQVYGFGEKTGHLNKRGMGLGGYHYTMWNSDTYGYDRSIDPIYVSVPFFMVMRAGQAHGIFVDDTYRSHFDIGRDSRELLVFGAEGGDLDYYFIQGPEPKQVIERYTALTGRMPLPPLWSLGYQQSRWGYYPESRVRALADKFRREKVPADVLWLDIDYQDGFKPFTWDRERFPDPKAMFRDLRAEGFRVVTIVDPHPKKETGYRVFDEGLAGHHFVRNPDGSLFEGPVWPSGAKKNPGNSVFPDFTRADTRTWWGGLHQELVAQGVGGIWNDMNEPAVWIPPANTMPLDVRHENDGHPTDEREIHNVYGMLHSRATFEGLSRLRPNERPFVLTRASFAGGQRYAAVWPGDNTADWSSLRQSLPLLMGMGISGFSFVGADIGGFAGYPTPELFTRWLQAAVFSPFMRAHTEQATPDQEPWSFGEKYTAINRRTIELRYRLLPQIYTVMEEASRTGVPAMRPLFLEFPRDANTWSRDDEYLFGASLLLAPVLREAAKEREVYLPPGNWFDYWSGERVEGGRSITRPVGLDSIPLFVREGAFIFQQPVVQNTGEMPGKNLSVQVYPATESEAPFYEDDGLSLDYRRGLYARRNFRQQRVSGRISLDISAVEGKFRGPARMLDITVLDAGLVTVVRYQGKTMAQLASDSSERTSGWIIRDGVLHLRFPDGPEAMQLTVETGSR